MPNKTVISVVIFILLIVVLVVYLATRPSSFIPQLIHLPTGNTNTIVNTTNKTPSNKTITTNTTNNTNSSGLSGECISSTETVPVPNGNFSLGTYQSWTTTGLGFGSEPFNIISANNEGAYYGAPWSGYNGTFIATTYSGGISFQAGNLTSDYFLVTEPYLNFKIISPQNNQLYLELLTDNKTFIKIYYNTYQAANNTEAATHFVNASIPLISLLCKYVRVRVVANVLGTVTTRDQYLAVTDFQLSRAPHAESGIIVNQTIS
ncbi:hypothetical protein M1394_01995 [Candidatus Marsarchaeota archaeon]|nr:hypothetical protein [Candidatus Marsarchaeota archaeon]